MSSRKEQVDVAIVGAGLSGLACAVALHRVRPDAKIKVYERRKAPEGYPTTPDNAEPADSSSKKGDKKQETNNDSSSQDAGGEEVPSSHLGGGVRVEMNGLKAIAAISRSLAAEVVSEGLYANKVLLHDTLGGAVMSRLHEPPHPSSPSPRQPALMIGWSELEALLLDRLPPGTVEWETVATGYTNGHAGVTLDLLLPSHAEEVVPSHALSTAVTHALDIELHQHMQQQREELEATPEAEAVPASPFGAAAGASPFSGTGPAPAAGPVAAAGVLTAARLERLAVRAKLLVAADGPMSLIRQQCVADGEPDFEGMVRWVGRLPGDMLSTIPVEQEAWWMGGGMTFASHPLSNGDVAWEAQVSSSCLTAHGLKWDQQTQSIIRDTSSSSNTRQGVTQPSADDFASPAAAAAPAGEGFATNGFSGGGSSSSASKRSGRTAAPADAPAGEEQEASPAAAAAASVATIAAAAALAQAVASTSAPTTPRAAAAAADDETSSSIAAPGATTTSNGPVTSNSSRGIRHVQISDSKPTVTMRDTAATSSIEAPRDVKALLTELFTGFPRACLDMIATTDERTILEGPVLTRPARELPACMGRGSVIVLGEAAHPVRPSGQEASQAFEDAAEFGACVMSWGVSREALRRFELRRRTRWTHVMQVSQAFGSVTNLGGVALHQGLLDYTAQLYHARFIPLKRVVDISTPHKHKPRRNPWLHWAGVALLTYGGLAAAGLTHRHLAKQGKSPLGPVLNDPVAQAVVNTVDAVGQSAVNLVSTAAEAVQDPGQAAAVIKQAAKKGVSATVQGSSQVAAAVGRGVSKVTGSVAREGEEVGSSSGSDGVVHGEVPSRRHRGVFARMRDGVVKRTLSVGAFLSRPFTHVLGHQVRGTVAETLGAF